MSKSTQFHPFKLYTSGFQCKCNCKVQIEKNLVVKGFVF